MATRASPRELAQAVAAYAVLLLVKLAVYLQTGMLSVLALALHSLGDVVASAFLLVAELMLPRAGRPVGRLAAGRARSAAALLAATVTMSFISFRLAEEALGYLLNPRLAVYRMPELAFALVLGSMLAGSVPIARALFQRRPLRLAVLPGEAHVMGALNDELSLLVGLAGIVLLNHGLRHADAWAALAIAVLIGANAIGLIRTHLHLLIGGPASPAGQQRALAIAGSVPGVRGVRLVDAEGYGERLLRATLQVMVAPGLPIEEAAAIAAAVDARLRAELGCPGCVVIPLPDSAR